MMHGNLLILLIILGYLTLSRGKGFSHGKVCLKDDDCRSNLCCFVGGSADGKFVCAKEEECDNLWCFQYEMTGLGNDFDGTYEDQLVLQFGAPLYKNKNGKVMARMSESRTSLALMDTVDGPAVYKQRGSSSVPDRVTFGGKKLTCIPL
jgi:hypothetical protein